MQKKTIRTGGLFLLVAMALTDGAPWLFAGEPPVQLRPDQIQQAATETQLQTADFGTPEATAKIAAKAGFVDVVGVKLGMPLKAALDLLKAHNGNLVMEPVTIPPYEALPGVAMNPLLASKKNTNTPSSQEKEYVGLLVTMAPSEPFVWGMWREVSYEKEESRPTIETIMAGLRKKYGQESIKDVGTRLIWMYDAQGQQVMKAKADEILTKCVSSGWWAWVRPEANCTRAISIGRSWEGTSIRVTGRIISTDSASHTRLCRLSIRADP